ADLLSGLDGPAALSDDAVRALLADPRREVSGKAAAVLATTAALDSRPNEHIDSLLAAAARSFPTHRERAVLEAVLARLDTPSGPLRAWLREPDQPAVLALRAALR